MAQPAEVERLAAELAAIYRSAWAQITAELATLESQPERWRRRARLRELEQTIVALMASVDEQARGFLEQRMPDLYALGAAAAVPATGRRFTWTAPHLDAVSVIAQDTFEDLLAATRHVERTTKLLVRELARSEVLSKLTVARTNQEAARQLRRMLEERGIWAVTYRDGSHHGLAEYAEVVMRTKTALAYNAGTITHAVVGGVRVFEVFDGVDCGWRHHDDSPKANGRIVTAQQAAEVPIAHPRCRRAFGPRPDLTESDVGELRPSTTASQREDQADAERARAATLARASRRQRRTSGRTPSTGRP